MFVRVDTRMDGLYQGVAESELCRFSFMHRVIVLFHFHLFVKLTRSLVEPVVSVE